MHAAGFHAKKTCSKCEKGAGSFSCDGCQQSFCLKHVTEHRQELIRQMDDIEQEHDILHDDLLNQAKKQNEHQLFNRIDRWEKESIEKIEQIANESRAALKQILDGIVDYGQKTLNKVSLKLRRARELDDFFENDLNRWTQQINHIRAEIQSMSNSISITNDHSTSVIQFIKIVHDQIVEIPDSNRNSSFSWLPSVKALFYDPSPRSSYAEDNTQTDAKDSIVIIKVDNTDHYIDIENSCWSENDQNMTGWTLRRDVNKISKIIYKFPDDFILKCRSHVRISFGNKPDIIENEREILFNEDTEQSWITGSPAITYLIDANGEEKASIIQILETL